VVFDDNGDNVPLESISLERLGLLSLSAAGTLIAAQVVGIVVFK
jgi:hypothetical protein